MGLPTGIPRIRRYMSNRKSLTRSYLLPLIGRNKDWYTPALKDVFLRDNLRDDLNQTGRLFLLVNNANSISYAIRGLPEYVIEYAVSEFETMFVLQLPSKFHDDYNRFINGQYSKFSDAAKKLIRENSTPGPVSVIDKDPKTKLWWEERIGQELDDDAELYDKPDLQVESYQGIKEGETPL